LRVKRICRPVSKGHLNLQCATAFGGTFSFLQTHKAKQKKLKSHQANALGQQRTRNNEGITRVWQKWRFIASYDSFSYI